MTVIRKNNSKGKYGKKVDKIVVERRSNTPGQSTDQSNNTTCMIVGIILFIAAVAIIKFLI